MILADITVSLKSPIFSVDHIIAFLGILLNMLTLAFAIWSNHKTTIATFDRQEKLNGHQKRIENTQKEISNNLNSTAVILDKINKAIEELSKEQEELANRISNIQVVMLQSEYKSFFSELSNHSLHVRNILITIDEYRKEKCNSERNRKFWNAIDEFNLDLTFFAHYNVKYKIKETFPQMLVLSFDELDKKYMAVSEQISSAKEITDCFSPIQEYSKVLDHFLEKVSAK